MMKKIVFGVLLCVAPIFLKAQNQNVLVTIRSNSMLLIESPKTNIAVGEQTSLSVFGCTGTVTWSDGQKGNKINVKPSQTTEYKATCVNAFQCVSSNVYKIVVGNPTLTLAAVIGDRKYPAGTSNMPNVCKGSTVSLVAKGCAEPVVWNNEMVGDSITFAINKTATYVATCLGQFKDSIQVRVATPQITAVTSSLTDTLIAGGFATLTASGCNGTVVWNTGKTGTELIINPTAPTTYTAKCRSIEGCLSNAVSLFVPVRPAQPKLGNLTALACAGRPVTLYASGCSGYYEWNGEKKGANLTFTMPTTGVSYTVVCVENGVKSFPNRIQVNPANADLSVVKLYPNPTVDYMNIAPVGCIGDLTVKVFSEDGQLLSEILPQGNLLERPDSMQLDFTALPSGSYIIHLSTALDFIPKRVLKLTKQQ
jgi:large repetitive protein